MEILTSCKKSSETSSNIAEFIPHAVRNGKDLFITPGPFFQVYTALLHEWGHVIGDVYSKDDSLTLYECNHRFSYFMDGFDIDYVALAIRTRSLIEPDGYIASIAEKALRYYLKGKDVPDVSIHSVDSATLRERLSNLRENEYWSNGRVKNSRYARNIELSAMSVELGCLMLTEKIFADYLLKKNYTNRFEYNLITIPVNTEDPYRRAQNIIAWARKQPDRKIPTAKDLGISIYHNK